MASQQYHNIDWIAQQYHDINAVCRKCLHESHCGQDCDSCVNDICTGCSCIKCDKN
jgi:hypothetical protein